jgi:BTB/POZ domain-containing protein KCTD9
VADLKRWAKKMPYRLSYDESLTALIQRGFLGEEEKPEMPLTMPSPLDDDPRLSFFRTRVEGDLSGLSIPRTLFCRSEICDCTFADTDLSESFLCWNDFTDVDFSSTVLRGSDLRSSSYTRVRFSGADLSGADLRRTTFDGCDFTGAVMTGAKMSRSQSRGLEISPEQKKQIDWSLFSGEEPPGG